MNTILGNDKGSVAIIGSIIVLAAVAAYSMNAFQAGDQSAQQYIKISKEKDIQLVKEKLTKLSGFLVANSLVVCKQKAWSTGTQENTCQWNSQPTEGDDTYLTSDFDLVEQSTSAKNAKELVFALDTNKVLQTSTQYSNHIKEAKTVLKFSLKHSKDLGFDVLSSSSDLDRDEYLVVAEGVISYKTADNKEESEKFVAAYRRPIAIPDLIIGESSCDQRCDVARTENPNKACRSDYYNDENSTTTIQMKTVNLGPGVLYDIQYGRDVQLLNGATLSNEYKAADAAKVPFSNIIRPRASYPWVDTVSCASITKNIVKTQYVRNDSYPVKLEDTIYRWAANAVDQVFGIPEAIAQTSSSSTVKNQHSEALANLSYSASSAKGVIEPKRGVAKNYAKAEGKQNGILVENTTIIYLVRPH